MTTEQWIKDHESSLGYHNKRLSAADTVKHMSIDQLEQAVLNGRSGMVTYARKQIEKLKTDRLHAELAGNSAYTDSTCFNPLYDASDADRELGIA